MKSFASLAVVGVLSCLFAVSCVPSRQASALEPPAASYQVGSFEFQNNGSSQKVSGASVTPAFFQGAKVVPLLGRGFLPEEYGGSSRQQVVLVSQRFWRRQFGGDPRIIGTTMHLNEQPFTVIGILPTTFDVPSGVDIWVPKAG